jgi:hypothetical protein
MPLALQPSPRASIPIYLPPKKFHACTAAAPLTPSPQDLCLEIRRRWGVSRVAVAHRVGVVEVCEASVIIAVSSPHRKPALEVREGGVGG